MKNIQIASSDDSGVEEVFAASEQEFALFFRPGEDIAFMDRLLQRGSKVLLYAALARVLARPVIPGPSIRVHGVLVYDRRAGDGGPI